MKKPEKVSLWDMTCVAKAIWVYVVQIRVIISCTVKFLEHERNVINENDKSETSDFKFFLTPSDQVVSGCSDLDGSIPDPHNLPRQDISHRPLPRRSKYSTKGVPPQQYGYVVGARRSTNPCL